jgi:WD40 repeat protein
MDLESGKELRQHTVPRSATGTLTLLRDGRVFSLSGPRERVELNDIAGGPSLLNLPTHSGPIRAVAISADGRRLISAEDQGPIRIWDLPSGLSRRQFTPSLKNPRDLFFASDERSVFGRTSDGPPFQLDVETGADVWPVNDAVRPRPTPKGNSRPTGRILITVNNSGTADSPGTGYEIWNTATRQLVARRSLDSGRTCLFLANRHWLAVEGNGQAAMSFLPQTSNQYDRLFVRDLVTGTEWISLSQPDVCGGLVEVSPDGHALLAVSRAAEGAPPQIIELWEIATAQVRLRISARELESKGPVNWCAFSPDSRSLVVSVSGALLVLNAADGHVMRRWPVVSGDDEVVSAAFSADARRLATGLANGSVLIWDTEKSLAPERAPLTEREREACWKALGQGDAGAAYKAGARLAADPEPTLRLFRDRLRPAEAAPAETIRLLIGELDSPQFALREAAMRALAAFGEQAESALKERRARDSSAELRQRIDRLLAPPRIVKSGEALRRLRAVQVLSWIADPTPRDILKTLSAGESGARETRAAQNALPWIDSISAPRP